MAFEFLAVGDLHYDNKLSEYIKDINSVISGELRIACTYARSEGIKYIILLGDLCDNTKFSDKAIIELIKVFTEYKDLRFIAYPGNHDTESVEVNSLQVLEACISAFSEGSSNVGIYTKPTKLRIGGEGIKILPWPSFAVDPDRLNFAHIEVNGAQWDHGKAIDTERTTEYTVISGHLHTNQVVGPNKNIYYPGTLYQKNFGERNNKFFMRGVWSGGRLVEHEFIQHKPKYSLHNIVIASQEDFSRVNVTSTDLYKAFIKNTVILDPNTLVKYPNIVKHNPFRSRGELEALLADELLLSDAGAEVNTMSVIQALQKYMLRASVDEEKINSAVNRLNRLLSESQQKAEVAEANKRML